MSATATDELTRMVIAVGTLMDWQSAVSIQHRPTEAKRSVVVQTWTKDGGPTPLRVPEWIEHLDANSWEHQRVLWRPAPGRASSSGAALAVPVHVDGEIRGTLAFLGPTLAEPDGVTLGLLEAIAGLLNHTQAEDGAAGPSARRAQAQSAGLGDVFAYTVRVAGDGTLQWRYFGPNSHEIFGERIYPDEPLSDILAQHAHSGDADKVQEFMRALVEGRGLDTELRVDGVDGITRWVSWRTVPRWTDGALFVDGVATDVSARHAVGRNNDVLIRTRDEGDGQRQSLQSHAVAVREANDAVLQRLFAAGLRLQMLKRNLGDVEAHAATAIAFQLDQAANDLREVIQGLDAVANDSAPS